MLLGLLQGPAELLPISSSGHVAALRGLLGGEPSKDLEVALHAGTAVALLLGLRGELRAAIRAPAVILAAAAPPALAGAALEGWVETRLGTPRTIAAGLVAGSVAMVLADRTPPRRGLAQAGPRDGLWLGLGQAAALVPGVSRTGATLAAARARGFTRPDASRLARRVGLPVLLGAAARRLRRPRGEDAVAAAAAFASSLAALRLVPWVDRDRPLWPWAAYRVVAAAAVVASDRVASGAPRR